MKLKQKLLAGFKVAWGSKAFFVFGALLLAFAAISFPSPAFADNTCGQTSAQAGAGGRITCDLSQITIKTDLQVKDSSGNWVNGAFVKAGADGSFTFKVIISLVSPTIQFNATTISVPNSKSVYSLSGIGSTLISIGGKECGHPVLYGLTYTKCTNSPFDSGHVYDATKGEAPVFQPGQAIYSNTFTVNHGDFGKLGITQQVNSSDPNSGLNKFDVIPMIAAGAGGSFWNSYTSAGKTMYVQLYATQSQANTSTTNPPTCTENQTIGCVPGYGGATGSGSDMQKSNSSPIMSFINEVIGIIFGFLQELIYAVFYFFIAPIMESMLQIHPYTDAFVAVIYPGWEIIRNLCNILFIVALIAIAMGTLFRIDSYQYKHLLVQLIIAALMINFSLVIGQAVLGLADTVQGQFLGSNITVTRSLAKDLMTQSNSAFVNWFNDAKNANANAQKGSFAGTIQAFFWLAMSTGALCVFGAITIFLVIRIVALWILLMVSPIAYAAGVLPTTAHYRSEWWSNFIKYAFFTPIMAFFLNMTAVMVDNAKNNPILTQILNGQTNMGSLASFVTVVASNILLLVFLLVGLKVADQFGIYGAHAITSVAQKGIFAPFGVAGMGGKALGGKIAQSYSKWTNKKMTAAQESGRKGSERLWRAAQFLNFRVAKEAWQERAHEKEIEAYEPSVGSVRDTIGRVIPTEWNMKKMMKGDFEHGFGQRTFYGRIKQQQMISKKEKEWDNADLSEEEKVEAWIAAHHAEDKEAIERLIIKGRHEDGRMITLGILKKKEKEDLVYNELIKNGVDKGEARARAEAAVAKMPTEYDAVEDLDNVTHGLEHAGLNSEQIGRIVAHLDELGEADRKLRAIGNAVYEFDNKFRASNDFSGYKKLEEAHSSHKMLEELSSLHNVFMKPEEGVDYDELDARDANGDLIKDKDGNVMKVKVFKQLRFQDEKGNELAVKNYNDLQSAIKATAKGNKEKGFNLRYEMVGARKQQSAQKRVDRGDSEAWGSALEPAAFLVQGPGGVFGRFTSYGKRLYQQYSTANINSLKKGRKIQARILKAVGLYKDDNGDLNIREKANAQILAQGFELNEDLTNAILLKADLDDTQKQQLIDKVMPAMMERITSGESALPPSKLDLTSFAGVSEKVLEDKLKAYLSKNIPGKAKD